MSDIPNDLPTTEERLSALEAMSRRLNNAIDRLVTEFLYPLTQQSVQNQRAIVALIESEQRHQEWLDENRQDIAIYRREQREQSKQIQILIEEAREDRKRADEDRKRADEKFDALQSEIRQTQRLMLSNQDKLDTTLNELISLSRRVTAIEDVA